LASLDRKLVEPFTVNYGETVERARAALLQRFGGR